jgi:hypothetical protein
MTRAAYSEVIDHHIQILSLRNLVSLLPPKIRSNLPKTFATSNVVTGNLLRLEKEIPYIRI